MRCAASVESTQPSCALRAFAQARTAIRVDRQKEYGVREISTIRTNLIDRTMLRGPVRKLGIEMEQHVFDCWTDEGKASEKEVLEAQFECGFSMADMTVVATKVKRTKNSPELTPRWHATIVASDPEKLAKVHQHLAWKKWVIGTWKS